MTTDQLKQKYPSSKFPPLENCPKCGGDGEIHSEEFNRDLPCMCIYFDHDSLPFIRDVFKVALGKMRQESGLK